MSDFKLPNAGAPQWYRTTPKADGITLARISHRV